MGEAGLVSDIYEAAVTGEGWTDVLDKIATPVRARGAVLFATVNSQGRWASSPGMRDVFADYVAEGWIEKGGRHLPLVEARHPGFLGDHVGFTEAEMQAMPIYREFLYPRDLGCAAGTLLPCPNGDVLMVALERSREIGFFSDHEVGWLDGFRPHLLRAAMLSARLSLERARGAAETLQALGLPGAVISRAGDVRAANALFDALVPDVFFPRARRVGIADSDADAKLLAVLDALQQGAEHAASIPVPGLAESEAFVLQMLPIQRSARDVFGESLCLMIVNPVTAAPLAPSGLFEVLLDLTPAEADIGRRLAAGQSLEQIAGARRVSAHTVRTQLKSLMQKTGRSRQGELAALFSLKLQIG